MAHASYGHREHRQAHSFGVNDGSYVLSNSQMDAPSQSLETDSNLARTMTSLPGPGQRTPSELQPWGPAMAAGGVSNVVCWQLSKDAPWTPLQRAGTQHSKHRPGTMPISNNGLPSSFTTYRGPTAPSDCETSLGTLIQSDSGYASGPPQSVGNPSVFGDGTESQSIIAPLSNFQLASDLNGEISHPDDYGRSPFWSHHGPQPPRPAPAPAQVVPSEAGSPNRPHLWCHGCNSIVKTRSELNKHKARHEKPFHCTVPDCKRSDGFGTKNDLDRHMRSRHPDGGSSGPQYICNLGQCAAAQKKWPRWDNFKQHLKRSHHKEVQNNQREHYQFKDSQCDSNNDFAHLGTAPVVEEARMPSTTPWYGSHGLFPSDMPYVGPAFGPPNPQASDCSHQDHGEELISNDPIAEPLQAGMGGIEHGLQAELEPEADDITISDGLCPGAPDYEHTDTSDLDRVDREVPTSKEGIAILEASVSVDPNDHIAASTTAAARVPGTDQDMVDGADSDEKVKSDAHACPGEMQNFSPASASADEDSDESTPGSPETAAPKPEQENASDIGKVLEKLLENSQGNAEFAKLFAKFGYIRRAKNSSTKAKKANQALRMTGGDQPQFRCDDCQKAFNRPCELKKHRKRHSRPYACTSAGCSKKFGSKNDWKRHENSQHFQIEVWKCQEKNKENASETCGKPCNRRETLKYHLQKDHGVQDTTALDQKVSGCRAGNECPKDFWCGFCKEVVAISKTGEEGWAERYDHIDLHFTGRENRKMQDISEWKHREGEDVSIDSAGDKRSHQDEDSDDDDAEVKATTTKQGSRKRSRSDQTSRRPAKRARSGKEIVTWFCCQCNHYWNGSLATQCVECQHYSCDSCGVERKRCHDEA